MDLVARKKVFLGALTGAAILGAAGFWSVKTNFGYLQFPAYQAAEIIDGDTFKTTDKQTIRLISIDAPEIGRCYSQESTASLKKLITGKKLYIKVIFTDSYRRLVSLVYTDKGLVNHQMAALGAAYFANGYDYGNLSEATVDARTKKLGIFNPSCRQTTNSTNPKCSIKAKFQPETGLKANYRFPGCGQYNNTFVDLSYGDAWFCTEAEAQKAGFKKAGDCYSQIFKPN